MSELLAALLTKMKDHDLSEYGPRGLANIVWALAKLQHYPDPELRALLLDTFIERLPQAVPQVRARGLRTFNRPVMWSAVQEGTQQLPAPVHERQGGGPGTWILHWK